MNDEDKDLAGVCAQALPWSTRVGGYGAQIFGAFQREMAAPCATPVADFTIVDFLVKNFVEREVVAPNFLN